MYDASQVFAVVFALHKPGVRQVGQHFVFGFRNQSCFHDRRLLFFAFSWLSRTFLLLFSLGGVGSCSLKHIGHHMRALQKHNGDLVLQTLRNELDEGRTYQLDVFGAVWVVANKNSNYLTHGSLAISLPALGNSLRQLELQLSFVSPVVLNFLVASHKEVGMAVGQLVLASLGWVDAGEGDFLVRTNANQRNI